MWFGFLKDKETTDAVFVVRQMQKKFRAKGKKLYFGFVDLEKAFGEVLREVIGWAMRKLGVEEWYGQLCLCVLVQKQLWEQFVLTVTILGWESVSAEVQCWVLHRLCLLWGFDWRVQSCLAMGVVVRG